MLKYIIHAKVLFIRSYFIPGRAVPPEQNLLNVFAKVLEVSGRERESRAPMNDVVLVQILDAFQNLLRVVAENFLLQGSEPRQNACDGTSGHELHEDADDIVFQASAEIPYNTARTMQQLRRARKKSIRADLRNI